MADDTNYVRADENNSDDGRKHSLSFPDPRHGTDGPASFAKHIDMVPDWIPSGLIDGALNTAAGIAANYFQGYADGGLVEGDTHHVPNTTPGRQRMRHEISPGVPCPSCANGETYPVS